MPSDKRRYGNTNEKKKDDNNKGDDADEEQNTNGDVHNYHSGNYNNAADDDADEDKGGEYDYYDIKGDDGAELDDPVFLDDVTTTKLHSVERHWREKRNDELKGNGTYLC